MQLLRDQAAGVGKACLQVAHHDTRAGRVEEVLHTWAMMTLRRAFATDTSVFKSSNSQ